tara:strand:+ start:150 stop:422 length:273 start_codon:yes stop_codon:yes gene_type:complete
MRVTDNGGAWMLRFENKKSYDIEFLWKEPVANLSLELQIGDIRKTLNIKPPTDTARIQNIKIPNGDAALSARILNGNQKQRPYHIVLIQK